MKSIYLVLAPFCEKIFGAFTSRKEAKKWIKSQSKMEELGAFVERIKVIK